MVSSVLAPLGVSFVDVGASIQCHAPQHTHTHFAPLCELKGSPLHVSSLSLRGRTSRGPLSAHCRRRPQQCLSLSLLQPMSLVVPAPLSPVCPYNFRACRQFSGEVVPVVPSIATSRFSSTKARHHQLSRAHHVALVQWSFSIQRQGSVTAVKLDPIGGTLAAARWYSPVSLVDASGLCTSVTCPWILPLLPNASTV